MKVADLRPASSPAEASFISTSKPRRSAQRRYMRSRISAQSWESVPPAPAWTLTTASPASYSPLKRRASSSSARRRSIEASCVASSAAISSSSEAISASSPRSATSASSSPKVLSLRWARECADEVRAAACWSSQNPGRCISASRASTSDSSAAGSKVVREQGQLLADSGQPRRYGLGLSGVGHGLRLLSRSRMAPLARVCCADDPGRRRRKDSVGAGQVGERLAQIVRDLRPDIVDPVFPESQDLAGREQRHVEVDRVIEVVADLQRQVAA